jgi:hypothetical protein
MNIYHALRESARIPEKQEAEKFAPPGFLLCPSFSWPDANQNQLLSTVTIRPTRVDLKPSQRHFYRMALGRSTNFFTPCTTGSNGRD